MGAQKNRLIEMVLLSTHNICFGWEIGENQFLNICMHALLSRGMGSCWEKTCLQGLWACKTQDTLHSYLDSKMALNSKDTQSWRKPLVQPQWAQPKTSIRHQPTDLTFFVRAIIESEAWPPIVQLIYMYRGNHGYKPWSGAQPVTNLCCIQLFF